MDHEDLEARVRELEALVAELRPPERRMDRRGLFAAGAAAAGAVVVGTAQPAAAAVGPLNIEVANQTGTGGSAVPPVTGLYYNGTATLGTQNVFTVADSADLSSSKPAAVGGYAQNDRYWYGLYGYSNKANVGAAVRAHGDGSAAGVQATSQRGPDIWVSGANALTARTAHRRNGIVGDVYGLYVCTQDLVADYRKIAGTDTAGALHPIAPYRAYDSRRAAVNANPAGALPRATNRTLLLSDSIDPASGALVAHDRFPVEAQAVAYSITAYAATNPGSLAIAPSGTPSCSMLEFPRTKNISTGGIIALGAGRTIVVRATTAAAAGAVHLSVDVVGYWR